MKKAYFYCSFDNLNRGEDYTEATSVIHIGFIDFTLFNDAPEFYATYLPENVKNHRIYTDKFRRAMVE